MGSMCGLPLAKANLTIAIAEWQTCQKKRLTLRSCLTPFPIRVSQVSYVALITEATSIMKGVTFFSSLLDSQHLDLPSFPIMLLPKSVDLQNT